ncbi:MAG: proteasome accessory factor PafA2, partial [Propionibacterium sp.]|nr:proteasome accessory factor PafA2 [Propionibacterium sp.]
RDGYGGAHPRLAQLALAWADLDAHASPYAALVRAGRMPRLTAAADVERAIAEPPDDTRAHLRGRLVAERTSDIVGVDWSWVLLQTRAGRRRLRLDDPVRLTAAEVDASGGLDGLIARLVR